MFDSLQELLLGRLGGTRRISRPRNVTGRLQQPMHVYDYSLGSQRPLQSGRELDLQSQPTQGIQLQGDASFRPQQTSLRDDIRLRLR